tara:strand:+ start:285 stop:707 length:423 start_codon:yes stop_codon:yes gene_type:complete
MIIRASSNHIQDILDIERKCFSNPWSANSFISEINNDIGSNWVYMIDSKLVGYLFGWYIKDEFHINNIAVHEDFRRLGIAEKMIGDIILKFILKNIFLEVSKLNSRAILLYEKIGFKKNGVRKKYYNDNSDAILYKMEIR